MPHRLAVSAHWQGDYDENALQSWASGLRSKLGAPTVSLGLVFITPRYFPHAASILEILRLHAQIPLLAGCSSTGVICGGEEIEENGGIVLGLYSFPDTEIRASYFQQHQLEEANGPAYWHTETGISDGETTGWLVFADPFHLDCDRWLSDWNKAYEGTPIVGGLASGDFSAQRTQIYLNGEVFEEGGVGLSFHGRVRLASVISQGCTPIGETWTITRAEQNLIHEIGNRPAYQVLVESVQSLPAEEQNKCRGNLFLGLVVDDYLEEFHRGDFLIRNLIGADNRTGSLAVAAHPRTGQTVQFQRRDARAATQDLNSLLDTADAKYAGSQILGACLSCCNGRGTRLFGHPNHDAGIIQQRLRPSGMTGFFCNGEIGPIGQRNFLHGYTASLALFLKSAG